WAQLGNIRTLDGRCVSFTHGRVLLVGVRFERFVTHDPQTFVWKISALLSEEESQNRQTPKPRHVLVARSRVEARARGAVLQAPRVSQATAANNGPACAGRGHNGAHGFQPVGLAAVISRGRRLVSRRGCARTRTGA